MIFPRESDWEFRPPLRSRVFGVDVPDLSGGLSSLSIAFDRLATYNDEVDLAVSLLECTIGVAPFGRWWWSPLLPVVVAGTVVVLATSIITSVISSVIVTIIMAIITTITSVVIDEDMAPMHTTMIGAWNGVEEVQQRFPSQEGGPRLIRFESPRWRPKAIQVRVQLRVQEQCAIKRMPRSHTELVLDVIYMVGTRIS
jgi:hypothetical protein